MLAREGLLLAGLRFALAADISQKRCTSDAVSGYGSLANRIGCLGSSRHV